MIDIESLGEVWYCFCDRVVGAVENDLLGPFLNTRLIEDGLQGHAFPAGIPHCAIAKLAAATRGLEKPRPFPEHWFTATISTGSNCIDSGRVSAKGASTFPFTSRRNA